MLEIAWQVRKRFIRYSPEYVLVILKLKANSGSDKLFGKKKSREQRHIISQQNEDMKGKLCVQ